jgi:protein TonB
MFETAILENGLTTKRMWATCAGVTGQALLVGCALLIPLLFPQAIPRVAYVMSIAPPGPPPPPPPAEEQLPRHARVIPFQSTFKGLTAPRTIPVVPLILVEGPEVAAVAGSDNGVPGGVPGGSPGGILHSILNEAARVVTVPKPIERTTVERPKSSAVLTPVDKPRRVSQVQLATPLHKVEPLYPTLAKQAGISGTVELMGVLGVDGHIHELRVLSGHPLLIKAAMDAVKQWVFAPTLLNGEPVEVQAPIQVNFILKR